LAVWFASPVRITRVGGNSMSSTYANGEWVLIHKRHYVSHPVQHGDVIVFRRPSDGDYIKRVYALPGETVWLVRQNDERHKWDQVITEQQATALLSGSLSRLGVARIGSMVVPPDEVFVLGDNVNYSIDSRDFGTVPLDTVLGYVTPQREFGEQPAPLLPQIDWGQIFRYCYPIR
jgi:signal peptidase I